MKFSNNLIFDFSILYQIQFSSSKQPFNILNKISYNSQILYIYYNKKIQVTLSQKSRHILKLDLLRFK